MIPALEMKLLTKPSNAPVHDNGVNERGEERGVSAVRCKSAPLGHSAAHDSGRGGRKSPLEEPTCVGVTGAVIEVFQLKSEMAGAHH